MFPNVLLLMNFKMACTKEIVRSICILYDALIINTYLAASALRSGTFPEYDQWLHNPSHHTEVAKVLCVLGVSFEMSGAGEFDIR